MLILVIIGSFILVLGLTFLFIVRRKTKIHAIDEVVADSAMNLFHIFGHSIYMPDDSPGFDIYRHYVFDLSNYQFTAGAHQQGKGIDINSPFVERSVQMLSGKMGRTLKLAPDNQIRSEIKVIHRDLNATDTEVIEKIPNNAFVVTKLRENEMGFSKVSLEIYRNGISIRCHVFKGWAEHEFRIYKTSFPNQVILMYSKGRVNYGIALAVIDLANGDFLFDQYITEPRKIR
ncbi:MAG: hypothetical protein A3D31_08170 [Candidatus Fluviicola riflensis]|nr:MAG: hypothetical protein CHH17_06835 [Candidatus Fluviicola riflensis]OGS79915.1 MAG: hypothetical protein A3D31_08170 [Candidatus Fluviicola riflensis]OGS82430.1 MAG: hypothetical protein A2724_17115 [Fluviicola sp. RIFCSPHIGHO2_01_FULL_43_53]OGS88094.1 MAG: hypothetical protein A3E30_14550 [Fluviicola sp. RIFCSPHIGHO2_12_FULL_43_24]